MRVEISLGHTTIYSEYPGSIIYIDASKVDDTVRVLFTVTGFDAV